MNSIENLLNLGVIKIDFDIELERTIFEMKYLMEQKKLSIPLLTLKNGMK